MDIVAIGHLTHRYGQRVGVDDLSLNVREGSLFGFLGPNGAGKTTAIRVMLGFLKADHGFARIFGLDCWRDSKRIKADAGYLPGDLRVYPNYTLDRALRVFGEVRGRDLGVAGRALAERFALDPTVPVRKMSRGMRQKLGLILAMAHEPRLLVLDEPTMALDPLMQERLYEHLQALSAGGTTIFFSSHTLSEVERLCDRVAILREGRLVTCDTLLRLRESAEREVVIRWRNGEALDGERLPAFLALREQKGAEWHYTLAGPLRELLGWVGGQPIDDLTIGPPDLESMFRRFYRVGASSANEESVPRESGEAQ